MNRRQVLSTLTIVTVVAGVGTSTLASAATKHKVIKGSYSVTALPDPTIEANFAAGNDTGCTGVVPTAENKHALAIPAAGVLDVVLDSPSPARAPAGYGTDWDLHILDAKGNDIGSSTSSTSHEETINAFKGKINITIDVCNLNGEPNATVTWSFTYKK
jgi:hypothetical protein